MLPINLICLHCLQHFFFDHMFNLYFSHKRFSTLNFSYTCGSLPDRTPALTFHYEFNAQDTVMKRWSTCISLTQNIQFECREKYQPSKYEKMQSKPCKFGKSKEKVTSHVYDKHWIVRLMLFKKTVFNVIQFKNSFVLKNITCWTGILFKFNKITKSNDSK